ncbi:SpoIIE family protein phosphatase [Streptomyces sp. PA03-1a]|nr:SpoIIE family protein phosphatase [Streptomyces sp. PA03-1a]MDX2816923.1 SpoIIE family protein phosphatase [Streptomyces sp. PA03-5A]
MTTHTDLDNLGSPHDGSGALFVVDGHGDVLMCTGSVHELTGRPPGAVCGHPVAELLTAPEVWARLLPAAGAAEAEEDAELRHSDGTTVPVRLRVQPTAAGGGPTGGMVVTVTPRAVAERRREDEALLRALFQQRHVGLAIHDMALETTRFNLVSGIDLPPEAGVRVDPTDWTVEDVLLPKDAAALREQLRHVAETGEPLVAWVHSARRQGTPDVKRVASFSAFRLHGANDRPVGVAVIFTDVTQEYAARQRMELMHAAAEGIGRSLDVARVAQELVDVLVSHRFADLAAVDLTHTVLIGQEPGEFRLGAPFRRVAVASSDGSWPPEIHPRGAGFRLRSLESDHLRGGAAVFRSDLTSWREGLAGDLERSRLLLPDTAVSFLSVPLIARGLVLGVLVMWRTAALPPYGPGDAGLAEELASRASLGLDNARRYTREHRTVEALQRSLLPPSITETTGVLTAGSYVPAGTTEAVGGAWFDVIPLSSSRLALVSGDVTGHGLNAAATMGRLRTAVQTLADLDLPPGELLAHMDDLVVRLGDVAPPHGEDQDGTAGGSAVGATCLYCVYDPVEGRCEMASAGHPAPVYAAPGAPAQVIGLKPGPALGVDSLPFEPVGFEVPPGGLLAFFNEPLLSHPDGSAQERLGRLCSVLATDPGGTRTPTQTGRAILDELLAEPPGDDVTLLVARMRPLPPGSVATWEFPADPAIVARARTAVESQLQLWDLKHLAFTTELITSELVTNAIRYGGDPVGLRLIRDDTLVCEVSDPSQTQPRLRRARLSDEGGRGLFLVAQLSSRWGSRYTAGGKTIWAEQPLSES